MRNLIQNANHALTVPCSVTVNSTILRTHFAFVVPTSIKSKSIISKFDTTKTKTTTTMATCLIACYGYLSEPVSEKNILSVTLQGGPKNETTLGSSYCFNRSR